MARYLYSELSAAVEARLNNQQDLARLQASGPNNEGNIAARQEWFDRWSDTIEQLCKDFMPSGSGFDSGTKIDLDASHAEKLVFHTSFHHMNDGGFYDGWTEHTVTVTPSFRGINIRIGGRNRNDIKDYIHESFDYALCQEIEWDKEKECWRPFRETVEQMQERVEKGELR